MADDILWIIVQQRRREAAAAARERLALASRSTGFRRPLGVVAAIRARLARSPERTLRPARGASGR